MVLSLTALSPMIAAAVEFPSNFKDLTKDIPQGASGITGLLSKIAGWFGLIVLGVSVIMILYAAFQFLTAGGDAEKVTSARNTLIYALVGIAVALLAYGAPNFISGLL